MWKSARRIWTGCSCVAWLAAAVAPAAADTFPSQALGIAADKAYAIGKVDTVNVFNGNLTLSIPLGQRYPVGANFSYGLSLVYNSNVWDNVLTSAGLTSALPKRNSNAGIGWLLTLGLIQEPTDPLNTTQQWLYTSPDGAEHRLYLRMHDEDPQTGGRLYTRDNTYIRMQGLYGNGTILYLDFPDGTVHTFVKLGDPMGFDWRLTQIADPFGNFLSVSYPNYPNDWSWVVSDSWNRMLTVNLEPAAHYAKRISSVVVPAFGSGSTATYQFAYTNPVLPEPCNNSDPANNPDMNGVSFLFAVIQPDGSSWVMPNYVTNRAYPNCSNSSGSLLQLNLPTRGQLQWTYSDWGFPTEGDDMHNWRTSSSGVATRTELSGSGALLGSWTYAASLTGSPRLPANEAVRLVTTPLNQTTASYFSVCVADGTPGWGRVEDGLPLTHNQPDGGSLSLSTLTYPCAVSDPAHPPCSPLRTTYLGYSGDTVLVGGSDLTPDVDHNERVAGSRTPHKHHDRTTAAVAYSNFDGLGHFRQSSDSGNFAGGNIRNTMTDYNPQNGTYPDSFVLPDINGPWVLGTYDGQTVADWSWTSKVEACFEPPTGFLNRKRILQSGTSDGPHDLLRVYGSFGGGGNVTAEDDFGGDTQSLAALCPSTCGCALGTGQYHVDNTFQFGSLATSRYAGAPFYSANGTIDANTGLVASSQDSSGLTTSYAYDTLGRLTSKIPPDAVATTYTYTPASGSAPPTVDITTNATHSKIVFDDFGRLWQEARLDPSAWNYRETLYDPAGNKQSVSEWQQFGKKTQYLNYDPFGRPQLIQPPDGGQHTVSLVYHGVRQIDRKGPIAGAGGERVEP